jgi:hypothetical protein
MKFLDAFEHAGALAIIRAKKLVVHAGFQQRLAGSRLEGSTHRRTTEALTLQVKAASAF